MEWAAPIGQTHDQSTGLMHYGARYYDPAIGRFISADTIVPNPADPQSLNRYAYVRNNPINRIDPTGNSDLLHPKFADGGVCPGSASRCRETYDYVHQQAEEMRADGMTAQAMAEVWGNGDNYQADMFDRLKGRGIDPNPGRSDMLPDSNKCLLGSHPDGGCIGAGAGRVALHIGKNVVVVALSGAAATAVCGPAAFYCIVAVGAGAGGFSNWVGEEIIDCVNGDCLNSSWQEFGWDFAEGAFLGGSGSILGHHSAWTLGTGEATAGYLTVFKEYGLSVTAEKVLEHAWAHAGIFLGRLLLSETRSGG